MPRNGDGFEIRPHSDPGYIAGYPPGVRENGGQYTHAALWLAAAFARRGDGDRAARILSLVNPVEHARGEEDVRRYLVEPYVVAADIYAAQGTVPFSRSENRDSPLPIGN